MDEQKTHPPSPISLNVPELYLITLTEACQAGRYCEEFAHHLQKKQIFILKDLIETVLFILSNDRSINFYQHHI